ncbi:MAG: 30S ribosomal protein S8 [Candidatus Paceibacterota bacterium]
MTTDPIADMLIRIKNGSRAKKETVLIPYSQLRFSIAEILLREGYLSSVTKRLRKTSRLLEVGLMYEGNGAPRVTDVERVSKSSKRVYIGVREVRRVKYGHGVMVLSTPKGLLTGDEARKEHVGGEVMFKIW